MARKQIGEMLYSDIYEALLNKVQRKERTKEELDYIICWLTGYSSEQLDSLLDSEWSYEKFFENAPALHPNRVLIKGKICGINIESIDNPLMKEIRYLDKLVDELAKGRPLEKILRQ